MRYKSWKTAKSVQDEFYKTLSKLFDVFDKICKLSGDDQDTYVRKMNDFQNSYAYEKFITSAVKRMVTAVNKGTYSTWRKASKSSTLGGPIYRSLIREIREGLDPAIQTQLVENANLIRTLPNDVAQKVVKDVADEALKGKRATSIAETIRKYTDQHARASAKLIARTEVSKTTTALNKARCEELGLSWYVWRTAEDGDRVRKSHREMDDVLVNWNDPPSPEELVGEKSEGHYHAGNIWNCRCYPEPLLEIDDVHWPHKVYKDGKIQTMTKEEFKQWL